MAAVPFPATQAARLTRVAAVLFTVTLSVAACSSRPEAAPEAEAATVAGQSPGQAAVGALGTPDSLQRVVLAVQGMACESCERTIAVMLRRVPGVRSADVSVGRREAVVTFDPAQVNPATLVGVVERLGYRATVKPA